MRGGTGAGGKKGFDTTALGGEISQPPGNLARCEGDNDRVSGSKF
jgi:hypothetical protein